MKHVNLLEEESEFLTDLLPPLSLALRRVFEIQSRHPVRLGFLSLPPILHILRVGEFRWRAKAQRDLPDAPLLPTPCGGLRFASNPRYVLTRPRRYDGSWRFHHPCGPMAVV
jgi:hypothetical protein